MKSKGRIKDCLGLKESYNHYKNTYDDPVDYITYSKLIKACNKELIKLIVNDAEVVELPYRLGSLYIEKNERTFGKDKRNWAIDFKKTKELGFVVYFDQQFLYKWKWLKHKSIVRNKFKYKFTASRFAKRQVAPALNNKKDYFKVRL